VTPERQNTFAAGQWTGSASFGRTNTTEITISNANFATNRTAFGKAEFTTTANDLAIKVPQMPPGTYRIELTGNFSHYLNQAGPLDSNCSFFLKDGTNTAVGRSQQYGPQFTKDSISTATAIVKYTSTADRTFTASLASGIAVTTECVVQEPKIIITPLDQPSNSALYVQGPVLGAATGAAIPAGYQGEELFATDVTPQNTTSATYNTLSLALTPGVWDVSGSCRFDKSTATFTDPNFIASITNQNTNPFETVLAQLSGSAYINSNTVGLATPIVRVRWDGVTNITYGSNNTSSNLVYIRCFPGTFTGGPVVILRRVRAIRVN
jgi:hypothetical protein